MSVPTAFPRVNSAWGADELAQLVQAWEEVVADPKDRLVLSTAERAALHARFCALSGSAKRSLSSITRQHHRLSTSYRLIVDTNRKSLQSGSAGWFDLSAAEQHELRRTHNKKEKGIIMVSHDLFRKLDRICGGTGASNPPLKKKQRPKSTPIVKAAKPPTHNHHKKKNPAPPPEPGDGMSDTSDLMQKSTWTARDWKLLVDAWKEAADDFLNYGNDPTEKVKLPNWLIRQKFVDLGGSGDISVGSIPAKKRCVIHSYQFIRQCVTGLEALDGSDWFDLSFNERFRLQRKLVSPKSSQRVGCELDRETYHKITSIIEKEDELGAVTGQKRKRSHKKARKPSVASDVPSEESLPRSPSPSPSRDEEEMSDPEESQPRRRYAHPPVYEDMDESQVDEKVIESLLEAQNARFEQLMHDLREERMEERKQNQAMLLEILHQRTPPEDPRQNAFYMETLVSKQQEQLMDLFAQMHKERQQEREDFHALLRQLCSRPRL
ncbi:unnamed protein product [Phytophthora lilii]|uniref:Unnamed protein product n=1 Tax=Phytophthora lilii TaxID=2077276 RepID=A0A9W6WRY2_9STRA|nr:unnamed protein product [Phytophthora lilii]